jgi:hypothetical protein
LLVALGGCAHHESVAHEGSDSAALLPSSPAHAAALPSAGASVGSASSATTSSTTAAGAGAGNGGIQALATHQPHPARGMAVDAQSV